MLLIKISGDKIFKQESLGWGDVKLSFIAGVVLGYKLGILYIFLGSTIALPFAIYITHKNKNNLIPFGPFLAISMLILFYFSTYFNNLLNILFSYWGV